MATPTLCALDRRLEREPFARSHYCNAVPADVAAENQDIVFLNARGPDPMRVFKHAHTRRVDEDAVALSTVDDLRIPSRIVGPAIR